MVKAHPRHHHRHGRHPAAPDGHNQASHAAYTNLYGNNMHPREWNSMHIEHTDAINYGRMSAIDRAIRTAGQHKPVGPVLKKHVIRTNVFPTGKDHAGANWHQFYRKYMFSQPETKYDRALSLDTVLRSSAFINRDPPRLEPTVTRLADPDDGQSADYPK